MNVGDTVYRCCINWAPLPTSAPGHFVLEGVVTETLSGTRLVISGSQVFSTDDHWFPTKSEALLDGVATLEKSVNLIFNACIGMRAAK